MLLQDDQSIDLRKGIYNIISRSILYQAVDKPPILACPDVIEWMTQRIDHVSRTILNFEVKHVGSYQDPMLNQMYHFK